MRKILVRDLVREVLGPRDNTKSGGMAGDPYDEFITGVLEPAGHGLQQDSEYHEYDDGKSLRSGPDELHDQNERESPHPAHLSTDVDPLKRASTMGLTFTVEAESEIFLKVCLTWARYEKAANAWKRFARWSMLDYRQQADSAQKWSSRRVTEYNGKADQPPEVELSTVINRIPGSDSKYQVSMFLGNCMGVKSGTRVPTNFCIFQPQMRINSGQGTRIVPLSYFEGGGHGTDDHVLKQLYMNDHVYARGHLVSAIWRDIDPEGASGTGTGDPSKADRCPPFRWVDGDIIPDDRKGDFSKPPEIRTEYVPIYHSPMPRVGWHDGLGSSPELSAEKLSGIWEPDRLKSALLPIHDEYKAWISRTFHGGGNGAKERLEECEVVAGRILEGINLLTDPSKSDRYENILISFCFANRVMALQSEWGGAGNGGGFSYRPFQMAFFLMCLESVVNPESKFRDTCDLMWVPTGTGKTEAYLALAVFVFSYRRRLALSAKSGDRTGAGVSVLTRYTLRLLTIQQFRRTMLAVAAAEFLRTLNDGSGMPFGWRPAGWRDDSPMVWGSTPFSTGLWIGQSMTPNKFDEAGYGWDTQPARKLLRDPGKSDSSDSRSDPAQVTECPACKSDGMLAVPVQGLAKGEPHMIHLVIRGGSEQAGAGFAGFKTRSGIDVTCKSCTIHENGEFFTLSLEIMSDSKIEPKDITGMWDELRGMGGAGGIELCSASAVRPGYFFRKHQKGGNGTEFDFDIFCPNPECRMRQAWCGGMPHGRIADSSRDDYQPCTEADGMAFPDGNAFVQIPEPFQKGSKYMADRTPINAYTCDYQVYEKVPTVLIGTSDKFARLPFEPKAASLFGNVDHHHAFHGYYRQAELGKAEGKSIGALHPPDLILQDELHLTDGPLGSMVGIYESAVDFLCSVRHTVKYISSTATIRNAGEHVRSVFNRGLQIFPPHGIHMHDRFFVHSDPKASVLDDEIPGRVYMGICAPGRGPLTPIIRIWALLAQSAHEYSMGGRERIKQVDPYWTVTGYFNAIRELAGARSLYRQDIPDRIKTLHDRSDQAHNMRIQLNEEIELSGGTKSVDLPGILDRLEKRYDGEGSLCPRSLFTTSMFGTGIDISRLGLMLVNGQPKTTSSYIQATGRVGRQNGGLIVTFYRSTRSRDLNHYEFFSRYHSQVYRFVEPPTAYPFSDALMEHALGPVMVAMLRNMREPRIGWGSKDSAARINDKDASVDTDRVAEFIVRRGNDQPKLKFPGEGVVKSHAEKRIGDWQHVVDELGPESGSMEYVQYRTKTGLKPVVLGGDKHKHDHTAHVVYENVPTSLRAVEEETTFEA